MKGGVATFAGLADKTAEASSLVFAGGGLTSATSGTIAVSPAAASQWVIHLQPSTTATAGQAFAAQPVVYEEDPFGNLITGDSSTTVTVSLGSGTGPLQGTTSATVSGGIATFTGLADGTAETITLKFSGGGLAAASSNAITIASAPTPTPSPTQTPSPTPTPTRLHRRRRSPASRS